MINIYNYLKSILNNYSKDTKQRVLKNVSPAAILTVEILSIFISLNLYAQEPTDSNNSDGKELVETDPSELYFQNVKRDLFLNAFFQRVKLRAGIDFSRIDPFVLEENAKSWLMNSIAFKSLNPNQPVSIPVSIAKNIPARGYNMAMEYSYRNRLHVELYYSRIDQKFSREDPTTVNFINPETSEYYSSAFEGVRLLQFNKEYTMLRTEYLHPFYSWLRIGGSLNKDKLIERNIFSFGSYNLSRSGAADPLLLTWSIGGDTTQLFELDGLSPGIVSRMQPYDWLEFIVRLELISRTGHFNLAGLQILEQRHENLNDSILQGSLSSYSGNVKEKGLRSRMEAIFQFCRFSIHTGIELTDLKRGYDSYLGASAATISGISFKTNGVGIGELSSDYRHKSITFFIEPSVSFHF